MQVVCSDWQLAGTPGGIRVKGPLTDRRRSQGISLAEGCNLEEARRGQPT